MFIHFCWLKTLVSKKVAKRLTVVSAHICSFVYESIMFGASNLPLLLLSMQ